MIDSKRMKPRTAVKRSRGLALVAKRLQKKPVEKKPNFPGFGLHATEIDPSVLARS